MNWRHPFTWAGIALNLLLLLGGWKLLNHELTTSRTLEREITAVQKMVETQTSSVQRESKLVRAFRQQREDQLKSWQQQLAPLKNDPVLSALHRQETDETAASDKGRIDFKVALFETRQRLLARAEQSNLWIPDDIGLSESIAEGDDTETRLWQLAAVAHLIDSALSAELPSIDYLRPLPWTASVAGQELAYHEYPVEFSVLCSYREWLNLLNHLSSERPYLALRRFRVEVDRPYPGTMLSVQAVFGGSRLDTEFKRDQAPGPGRQNTQGSLPLLRQPSVGGMR